jgi:hypothetical protein
MVGSIVRHEAVIILFCEESRLKLVADLGGQQSSTAKYSDYEEHRFEPV